MHQVSDEVVVRIENLTKSFDELEVLRGVNVNVHRGEVVVILGPSGSGKSTLLRCVNLLETPTSGKIFFEDTEITDPKVDINQVRSKLGMVFQSFNLFPHLTAKKNVMLAQRKVLKRSEEEAEKKAIEELTKVGLAERVDYKPSQLSGGQQQRTSIGRAIVKNPDLLLCDEPTGALDYNTSKDILKLIEDVNRKYGNTIIIVTHNDAIKLMADRVIKLRDGMIRKEYTNETKTPAMELDW